MFLVTREMHVKTTEPQDNTTVNVCVDEDEKKLMLPLALESGEGLCRAI